MLKKQPNVAIVTPGNFAIPSGRSSSVELVVHNVAKRASEDVKLFVFGKKTKRLPAREVMNGVVYHRPVCRSRDEYIRKVSSQLSRLKPDLIQVENRPWFVRFLRRRHPHTPIWLSLHSLTYASRPFIGPVALRKCLKAADRIVVNSHFLRERLQQMAPECRAKIRVNHLGVDMERFTSRWEEQGRRLREEMLAKEKLQGKKIILYVGRWIKQKGVHKLLEAMPEITRQVPEAMLVVIGGAFYGSNRITPYVRSLYKTASKLPGCVRFVEFVPHNRIGDWYRLADVQIVPSLSKEAFGLVNVEAMATGVPVIGTMVGGVGEVISHGVTGYLVDPKRIGSDLPKLVVSLLKDEELRRCMGEQSLQHVRRHFTWDHTVSRWVSMLGE